MNVILVVCLGVVFGDAAAAANREKRGVPVSGGSQQPYGGDSAITQLNNQEAIAEWSASNAVGNAVASDYSNQLATTAQFVAQFTAPVTKEQAGRVFNTIANHQKANGISSALAHNTRAIHYAAQDAASSNYDQAYQAQALGYHRGSSSGGSRGSYGGGGSY